MGDRDPGASAVVGEGSVESPRREPVPAATFRQLQHGGGLVPVKLADHYGELAGAIKQVGLPIGAGIGKIFRIGDQPINASLQAFDYVLSPTGGPRWAVRAYLVFLFPR